MVERIQGPTPGVCSKTGGTYLIHTRYEGCVTNWWRLLYFGRDLEFLVGEMSWLSLTVLYSAAACPMVVLETLISDLMISSRHYTGRSFQK